MLSTNNNALGADEDLPIGTFFTSRLQAFLSPLLVFLDQHLDKRLVHTFCGLCTSIIRLRNHSTGLYLSELGSYLLSGAQAPAATKRISNLLRSAKWQQENLINYLGLQAQVYAQQLQLLKEGFCFCGMRVYRKNQKACKVKACVPCAAAKPNVY